MGFLHNMKERAKNEAKKEVKKKIKKAIIKVLLALLKYAKFLLLGVVVVAIISFVTWVVEKIMAEDTPPEVYESLEVDKVTELVQIKGNENDGYHLEFAEDIDDKLDTLIKELEKQEGVYTIKNVEKELLKSMLKAEAATQFPDLGGKIDEKDSNQFQGAITVRRVTPDKKPGELKSTGAGEKATADDLKQDANKEDKKITYDKGQELEINTLTNVYLKGTYNILGEKKEEAGVTLKGTVLFSNIEGMDSTIQIQEGQRVYYTGETFYENHNTYIEVKKEKDGTEVIGYIKNVNVNKAEENQTTQGNSDSNNDNNGQITPTKVIGSEEKQFVIAIAAGHNNADDKGYSDKDIVEEELTMQVASKVEELFKEYKNVKVVQTGSTKDNKGGVKRENRAELAKNEKPDLCVQIYFNSEGSDSGVEANYEYGDGKSQKFATLLSEKMAKAMNLPNKGAITEGEGISDYYDIIDSSADSGFPSVITKGGNLANAKDKEAIQNGGINQYAKGIVEACEEYLISDKGDDTVTYVKQNDNYSRTKSRIYNLKYVPLETFQEYIKQGDAKVLDCYTLDESYNLLTATWNITGTTQADAVFKVTQNSAMNFRTILQKVTMPYEYLLLFLIDSDSQTFVEKLADTVINDTEIVIAVQDNVTTTKVDTTVQRAKKIVSDTGGRAGRFAEDWHTVPDNEDSFTENCSSSVEITYANTWFMKYSKGNTYSSESLNIEKDNNEVITKNVKGKVNETKTRTDVGWNNDDSGGKVIDKGSGKYTKLQLGTTSKEEDASGESTKEHTYTYEIRERKATTTHTISNTYESGEATVAGQESKFIKLYKENKMENKVAEAWLIDILANNEKTANLVDLTKYMMYQATNVDHGVTDYDFSEFDLSKFEDMSAQGGLDTFKEYLHTWEGNTGISADGKKYIVGTDGAGHPTVGYGIDIYNSGFLDRFIAAGYDVSIGAQIDVEFVDALEDEEIQSALQTVEAKCSGLNLKLYQKYALVSRIYNCGSAGAFTTRNGKNFIEAYNAYWNPEKDDEYKVASNDGMYSHSLYQQYMDEPVTSNGNYMKGLERRRKSEWILFKTGYYDNIGKWCTDTAGGTIVEKAVECHEYLRTNGFYYAQAGVNIPISGKGRTIDCSSYVSWVLYESGISEMAGYQQTSYTFYNNKWGWQEISVSEAQPGDILIYSGHVEIMAADAGNKFRVYNCGGNSSINAVGTSELPESSISGHTKSQITKILRAPQ